MRKSIYPILFLMAGCARVPDHDLAKRIDTVDLHASTQTALNNGCVKPGEFPNTTWWELFEDPQLSHLIHQALKSNPTLQRALARVTVAEQEVKAMRAPLFPSLSADATEEWQYFSKNGFVRSFYPAPPGVVIPATTNQLDLALNFNYELDFFGKNRHRFESAIYQSRSQQAELAMTQLLITTLVTQTYLELQMRYAQQQILEQRVAIRKTLFDLAALNTSAGLDNLLDPLAKEVNVHLLEEELLSLNNEIALDTHMLCSLVGKGADESILPAPLVAKMENPLPLPTTLSSDLIARRPDLTAQIWKVEAAAELIGAAKADFYPRVNLMAFAGLESLSFNKLFKLSSKQGGLEPAIHLPIFTGGALSANLKKQVALFNEETHHYNEMIFKAMQDVADGLSTLTTSFDRLSHQITSVRLTRAQWQLQEQRRNAGLNPMATVLSQQESLLAQETLLVQCHRDYLLAIVKLIKAIGGGYGS